MPGRRTTYCPSKLQGNPDKVFVNNCVNRLAQMTVPKAMRANGVVLALDDTDLLSSRAAVQKFPELGRVLLAQHNMETFKSQNEQVKQIKKSRIELEFGDYSQLDGKTSNTRSVFIDQADTCCTWNNIADTLCDRLHKNVYADRAVVRITVSTRSRHRLAQNKRGDQAIADIIAEYTRAAVGTGYCVQPVPVVAWTKKKERFTNDDEALYYAYWPSMATVIFLVTRNLPRGCRI